MRELRRCCVCDLPEKPGMDFNAHESGCILAERVKALRAQKAASTDPARLERETQRIEGKVPTEEK